MLPNTVIEETFADEDDEICHNFILQANNALQLLQASLHNNSSINPPTRSLPCHPNVDRQHLQGHQQLLQDYFDEYPTYDKHTF